MIIPWLKGFLSWSKVPVAWAIVLTNVLIFMLTNDQLKLEKSEIYRNQDQLELTGKLYYQFKGYTKLPSKNELSILAVEALKDVDFIEQASTFQFSYADKIELDKWKKNIIELHDQFQHKNSFKLGVSKAQKSWLSWVTYQFMHGGFIHLLSNMLLLLIFSAALESQVGGLAVIFLYITSGLMGAFGYFILGHPSLAPMIGASGSLSGLMSFYAIYERKKNVPFFYFLSPIEGYMGLIYLPTLMILPLCFLTDFASYLSMNARLGSGVAYSAHLGGLLYGILLAVLIRMIQASKHWLQVVSLRTK